MVAAASPARRASRAAALPPDERRRAIVAATLPLLLEHGEMATTRQIAEAAGIAEGTIFRVFADKDELVGAVIDQLVDPTATETALSALDPAAELEVVLTEVVAVLQRRTMEIGQLMSSVGPRFADRVRRPVTASRALNAIFRAHAAELALSPAEAARRLRAIVLACSHPLLSERPVPPAEITAQFLHGIARRPSC